MEGPRLSATLALGLLVSCSSNTGRGAHAFVMPVSSRGLAVHRHHQVQPSRRSGTSAQNSGTNRSFLVSTGMIEISYKDTAACATKRWGQRQHLGREQAGKQHDVERKNTKLP